MPKTILIVDDDVELCSELTEILFDKGYSVEVALNGAEAQKRITSNIYDIIVLDYRIPDLTGADILRVIKEKRLRPKILLTSGKPFVEKAIEAEGLKDLVSYIIAKPFNIEVLLEKIES